MFRGVAALNLDAKGRLAVPARHRDVLLAQAQGRLVVTADPSQCLLIYPQPDWEPIQEQILALPSFNPQSRALQRLLVGYAEDVELDGAGRILLSAPLREFAGLTKKVMLVGQGRKFELWDEDRWNAQRQLAISAAEVADWPSQIGGLSL